MPESQVDISDFLAVSGRTTKGCTCCSLIESLPSDKREQAIAALKSDEVSHPAIATVLSNWTGKRISDSVVGDCRRRGDHGKRGS